VIEALAAAAFVVNCLFMCLEDIRYGSVSLSRVLLSLFLAASRSIAEIGKGSAKWPPVTLGSVLGLLIMGILVVLGTTGVADFLFLASLQFLFPEGVILSGISFLFRSQLQITVTLAEAALTNALLLLLRYRVLSRIRTLGSNPTGGVPDTVIMLVPLAWTLPILARDGRERVPFLPFMTAGAVIGVFFNTLLV